MSGIPNSPYLSTPVRSEREVERARSRSLSIQKIIEKGREGGLPTAEIEKGVNNFRGAYLLADAVAQFGRVR